MEREEAKKLRAFARSEEVKAARKLNNLVLRWAEVTDSDIFEGFSNPAGFKKMKAKIAEGVRKIAELGADEARLTGLERYLEALTEAIDAALHDFPIPRGIGEDSVSKSFNRALKSDKRRFRSWWRKHRPRIRELATKMGLALSNLVFDQELSFLAAAQFPYHHAQRVLAQQSMPSNRGNDTG